MSVIGIVGEGRGFCGGGVSASRGRRGGESGIELNSDYYYNTMGDQDGASGHDNGPGLPTFDTKFKPIVSHPGQVQLHRAGRSGFKSRGGRRALGRVMTGREYGASRHNLSELAADDAKPLRQLRVAGGVSVCGVGDGVGSDDGVNLSKSARVQRCAITVVGHDR